MVEPKLRQTVASSATPARRPRRDLPHPRPRPLPAPAPEKGSDATESLRPRPVPEPAVTPALLAGTPALLAGAGELTGVTRQRWRTATGARRRRLRLARAEGELVAAVLVAGGLVGAAWLGPGHLDRADLVTAALLLGSGIALILLGRGLPGLRPGDGGAGAPGGRKP